MTTARADETPPSAEAVGAVEAVPDRDRGRLALDPVVGAGWWTGLRDWAPVLAAVLPALCIWLVDVAAMGGDRVPASDIAVLEMATRNAVRGRQFLGAYSRYGWSHPGPAMFYWFAPFWELSGRQLGGLAVAAATMSLATVAVVVRTVQRVAGRAAAWATAGAIAVLVWLVGYDHLQSPWNPELVILPIAALGVVGAAAAVGRRWALPISAFYASWAAQAHLGAVPITLALSATIVAMVLWRQRHHLSRWLVPALLAVVVVTALWAPVAWEEVTRSPGNVTLIRQFFDEEAESPHSWSQSTGAVVAAVVGRQDEFAPDRPVPLAWRASAAILVVLVALGVIGGWAHRRDDEGAGYQTALATLGMVGLAVAVVSVHNVRGSLFTYLLSFATGLGFLLWVSAAVTVGRAVERLPAARRRGDTVGPARVASRPALASLATGLVVVVVVAVAWRSFATGPWNRNPDFPTTQRAIARTLRVDNDQARSVADSVMRSGRVRSGQRVEVVWPTGWEIGAGVVNQLERVGVRATVPQDLGFVFGEELTSDGSEVARIVMLPTVAAGTPYPETWPTPPDARFRVDDGLAYRIYVEPIDR